jgi:hypothetical protein
VAASEIRIMKRSPSVAEHLDADDQHGVDIPSTVEAGTAAINTWREVLAQLLAAGDLRGIATTTSTTNCPTSVDGSRVAPTSLASGSTTQTRHDSPRPHHRLRGGVMPGEWVPRI